jgi:peptidoglycan/LPS O-acetylase OafA/YrhL
MNLKNTDSSSRLLVPTGKDRSEPNNLDLIRISMAMLVVWSHSFALYFGSESSEPISRLTGSIFNSGNIGVDVFFIVSGFLITQSFQRSKSSADFLKKRIARIYPGYFVAVCICAFVIIPIYSTSQAYSPIVIARTLFQNLLLRNYFVDFSPFHHNPGAAINGSLWSIPYEFRCYLGVLGLGAFGFLKQNKRGWLLASFIGLLLMGAWLEISGMRPSGGLIGSMVGSPYLWSKLLPCFQAGMLVHQYRDKLRRSWWIMTGSFLALIAVPQLPVALAWKSAIVTIVFPPISTYAVFYFAFRKQVLDAARYGDFSYGTYLYAYPVQQMILAHFSTAMPFGLFVLSGATFSLAAGIASWYIVEQWFSRSFRKRKARESRPEGASSPSAVVALSS